MVCHEAVLIMEQIYDKYSETVVPPKYTPRDQSDMFRTGCLLSQHGPCPAPRNTVPRSMGILLYKFSVGL